MFDFLRPRWKKDARHLVKGAKKFVHYKRDVLDDGRIAEIESRRDDLRRALKSGDRKLVEEAGKQLRATCEKSLPRAPQQSWWEENVEVMFVALVIALGLRAYVLQPFRIPTGSMQPTLNGITVHRAEDDFEKPWFGQRVWEWVWRGRTYKEYVAKSDIELRPYHPRQAGRPASFFLFTRTAFDFSDGTTIKVPAESNEADRILRRDGAWKTRYAAGETIFNGWIDTGDLVLVDKISYHFRKPKRGEVFVFDTRGIPTHGQAKGTMSDQTGGSHYIKRLCGVPGDRLQIDPPHLYVNDAIATEPGIVRVMKHEGEYAKYPDGRERPGYILGDLSNAEMREVYRRTASLTEPGEVFALQDSDRVGMREYAALGDNTANSLDSRYWGAVHEFNLAGPGWFSLWPFGTGHWGFIK